MPSRTGAITPISTTIRRRRVRALSACAPLSGRSSRSNSAASATSRSGRIRSPTLKVIFKPEQFQPVIEWLMLHRDGLDVLIHPLTDNSVDDHSIYAMWLGSQVPLKLDVSRRSYRAELLPSA